VRRALARSHAVPSPAPSRPRRPTASRRDCRHHCAAPDLGRLRRRRMARRAGTTTPGPRAPCRSRKGSQALPPGGRLTPATTASDEAFTDTSRGPVEGPPASPRPQA
jgi:hypothetical protein